MKEISNETLQAFLDEYIPFETVQPYGRYLIKIDFMGDEYVMDEFGSWYPLRDIRMV